MSYQQDTIKQQIVNPFYNYLKTVNCDKLEPNQSLGIKKDFTLTSSEPNKKVTLKIKLQYTINSEEKTEQFMIKNL